MTYNPYEAAATSSPLPAGAAGVAATSTADKRPMFRRVDRWRQDDRPLSRGRGVTWWKWCTECDHCPVTNGRKTAIGGKLVSDTTRVVHPWSRTILCVRYDGDWWPCHAYVLYGQHLRRTLHNVALAWSAFIYHRIEVWVSVEAQPSSIAVTRHRGRMYIYIYMVKIGNFREKISRVLDTILRNLK